MIKPTSANQKKLEEIIESSGYKLRYEKGNFNPGYCIVKEKRVVLINRFYPMDAKISAMLDLLPKLHIDESLLDDEQKKFVTQLTQQQLEL